MNRRPSAQTIDVLRALSAAEWRYGYELGQEIGLKAGSLYPILIRLSERGLLESSWEPHRQSGRPPRHLYRLTPSGYDYAAEHVPVAARAATSARVASPRIAEGLA